jgi:hypothetical protein
MSTITEDYLGTNWVPKLEGKILSTKLLGNMKVTVYKRKYLTNK